MAKLTLAFLVLLSTSFGFAQEPSEEISEFEMMLQMDEKNIADHFEHSILLYNSILSREVNSEAKCTYLEQLKASLTKLDIAMKQYLAMIISKNKSASFFDAGEMNPNLASIKLIHAYQLDSRLQTFMSALPILDKNNHCN